MRPSIGAVVRSEEGGASMRSRRAGFVVLPLLAAALIATVAIATAGAAPAAKPGAQLPRGGQPGTPLPAALRNTGTVAALVELDTDSTLAAYDTALAQGKGAAKVAAK